MPSATEIKVMGSAAIKEAFVALASQFERASGHKVIPTWIGGVEITKRVAAGEFTDLVFQSATAIDSLIQLGKLAAGSRVDIATSWVAVGVKAGAPRPDISNSDAFKRTLLAAKSIAYSTGPSGVYLIELFKRMGIADAIANKVTQIKGEPVGASVARGEIEIGFQQMSELLPVAGIDIIGPLPAEIQEISMFSVGLHTDTRVADAAREMIRFFKSPAAHAVFRSKGMEPAI
jgi:molybdate transport system substrate-binding protein